MKRSPSSPFRWSQWISFNATVFAASACVMVVEILSTRLVARHLGASLYTWTSAIGVVLSGISLGNYLGGRIADRYNARRSLSLLFLLSALSCITIPVMNQWLGTGHLLQDLTWPARIFWHFTITFLVPSTLLGTMSPVVARMALKLGREPGRTIGTIYAWGAIGSIVGTFAAGFFLIAWAGTTSAILCVSAVLAAMGIMYGFRSWVPYAGSAALLAFSFLLIAPWAPAKDLGIALGIREIPEENVIFAVDSQYQHVTVQETGKVRTLVLDALVHSKVDLGQPGRLLYDYELVYAEALQRSHPGRGPLRALFIGGGGFVFPRYLEVSRPGSRLVVTEIDPVVTEAALKFFGVPRSSSIQIHNVDAHNYVEDLLRLQEQGQSLPKFDAIFGDAFNDLSIPFHLTTLEFTRALHSLLKEDGVYLLNLIDAYDSGRFLSAVWNTSRQVFEHVEVFATTSLSAERTTFVLVCSNQRLNLERLPEAIRQKSDFEGMRLEEKELAFLKSTSGGLVLTDDYAPVENLLIPTVERKTVPLRAFREALELVRENRLVEAELVLRGGLKKMPRHQGMLNELGHVLGRTGRPGEARYYFAQAVEGAPHNAAYRANYGKSLQESGLDAQAAQQYRACLEITPDNLPVLNVLVRLLASSADDSVRDGSEAVKLGEELVRRVGPNSPDAFDTLAAAYARAGFFEKATQASERAIQLASSARDDQAVKAYRERLTLYLAGQPYVESSRPLLR